MSVSLIKDRKYRKACLKQSVKSIDEFYCREYNLTDLMIRLSNAYHYWNKQNVTIG